MKRTCNNCKANEFNQWCNLNYKTRVTYNMNSHRHLIPLEECPKPQTNDAWVKEFQKNNEKLI